MGMIRRFREVKYIYGYIVMFFFISGICFGIFVVFYRRYFLFLVWILWYFFRCIYGFFLEYLFSVVGLFYCVRIFVRVGIDLFFSLL